MSLQGKVAVVTGASSGIGQGIALALAAEGCAVALAARRVDITQATADEIAGRGGRAIAVATDVTVRADVKALAAAAEAQLGPVDILVNAAGVMYFTMLKNLHEDEWERTIDTNCKGVVNGVGAAFVAIFSKGLRAECVGTGVAWGQVTDVQPGDVGTNLIVANTDKEAAAAEKMGVSIGEKIAGERNSVLDVADIASAVLYALTAPAHVGVHELLIEPRDQMWGDPTALG
ncbi:hypothetical protein EMIHUDRAFT_452872 [Emiliania huxleyi CCMP1516]|uniref:Uncharacterized protein n=2 Tax=Emiliania huxleyi TaxID=2903 RepID=A0A0D3ID93_EMIH1|nr:hypothetical protein EMIHUDRAFT_452872 [Emiliania huxleyi CCMP1516]EOD09228.1 hypothetical protein EMIHUDRAFT_452872 [Emiliania huxleyi CCMP1516]|eukprot:XP_005761657.1 hypothetical protein EMIHUDRAFT_452872 [Emiliania huxleyi CCMP1516]